jgi:hypothetical protein
VEFFKRSIYDRLIDLIRDLGFSQSVSIRRRVGWLFVSDICSILLPPS